MIYVSPWNLDFGTNIDYDDEIVILRLSKKWEYTLVLISHKKQLYF